MHVERTELGQHGRQAMQHRTHAASNQGDGRTWRDHLDPTKRLQVFAQLGKHVGAEQIVRRIERYGDVGFCRTDQVDR